MPTLLSLPLELRLEILKYVLTSSTPAPSSPRACTNGPRIHPSFLGFKSWTSKPYKISYPSKPPIVNAISLLLINRQLHTETKDILSRNSTANVNRYLLDVMLVDEDQLWPTWLCIPSCTTRVDTVRANFRVFGTPWVPEVNPKIIDWAPDYQSEFFQRVPRPQPVILWTFFVLLEIFLRCGCGPAVACESDENADGEVTIGTLELDFLSPEDPFGVLAIGGIENKRAWWSSRGRWTLDPNAPTEGEMRPEWLLDFVKNEIASLLAMNYSKALYGKMLYERIGVIKLLLNGELDTQWDLGEMLKRLERFDEDSTFSTLGKDNKVDNLRKWKDRTLAERKEAGFPVLAGDTSTDCDGGAPIEL